MKDGISISQYWTTVSVPTGPGEILTNATDVECSDGPLLVGVDSSRCKHLLVPCGDEDFRQDRQSRGVALVQETLIVGASHVRFADLVCVETSLESAFLELADDISRRIRDEPTDAVAVVQRTLREWRDLLRYAGGAVDRSKVVGLRGELEVLRAVASGSTADAVASWRGPRGEPFDFMRDSTIVEVKTTTSQDGHSVQIHGLQQLDPPAESELNLAFVRLRPDDLGESIPALIDDLYSLGIDREELDHCLRLVGYQHELREAWSEAFKLIEMTVWRIDEDFPGIRASRLLPEALRGVSEISYTIDLDAGGPPLDAETQTSIFARLSDSE